MAGPPFLREKALIFLAEQKKLDFLTKPLTVNTSLYNPQATGFKQLAFSNPPKLGESAVAPFPGLARPDRGRGGVFFCFLPLNAKRAMQKAMRVFSGSKSQMFCSK